MSAGTENRRADPPWSFETATLNAFRDSGDGDKYIDRLLAVCKDSATAAARNMYLLIGSMVAFELVNRAQITELSASGVKISNPSTLMALLLSLSAFFQYQVLHQTLRWRRTERAFTAAISVINPHVSQNMLDGYVVPSMPLMSTRTPGNQPVYSAVASIQQRSEATFALFVSILLPGFQVYAILQVIRRAGADLLSVGAVVAAAALTLAYLAAVAVMICSVIANRFGLPIVESEYSDPAGKSQVGSDGIDRAGTADVFESRFDSSNGDSRI